MSHCTRRAQCPRVAGNYPNPWTMRTCIAAVLFQIQCTFYICMCWVGLDGYGGMGWKKWIGAIGTHSRGKQSIEAELTTSC